jgi:FkbM family methyltransferase
MDISAFRDELEQLYVSRVRSKFPRLTKEELLHNGIIIFGAREQGTATVYELIACGITPLWIADNNADLHGKQVCGVPVRSAASLAEAGDAYVMLASSQVLSMIRECEQYGAQWVLPAATRDFCRLVGDFGICGDGDRHLEEILSVFSLFADDKSRDVFRAFIRYHHTFENDFSPYRDPALYFPEDLRRKIDYSFFVDAGAFVGDTLGDWVRQFNPAAHSDCAYYAFEPSAEFRALQSYVERLPAAVRKNIYIYQSGLGAEDCTMLVCGQGMSARLSTHAREGRRGFPVPVRCCDSFFNNMPVSIIKADVEGVELDLLKGGEALIRRCRPSLAISVYHWYADIWEIPFWIRDLDLGYRLYLRHHQSVFSDTVCYAVPL